MLHALATPLIALDLPDPSGIPDKHAGTPNGNASAGCPPLGRIARCLLFLAVMAGGSAKLSAQSVRLGWNASPDPTVTGYVLCWGSASGDYTNSDDAGAQTTITISNLSAGTTYYFAVAAYNASGDLSPYTSEVSYTVPGATGPVAASIAFSGLTQTYTGAPETVTVTTSPANLAVTVTYNGSINPPVNAGAYTVVATVADPGNPNYTGSATDTLLISPAAAIVALSGLTAIYNGSPQTVTVTTTPSGIATTSTYNGNAAAPANIGSYAVLCAINDPNYTVSAAIPDTNYAGGITNNLTIYDPTNALVLTWPVNVNDPAISESTNLTAWVALAINIGPTNQLVVPKQPGNQFFQGLGLQIVDPSR